ncbi:hypothetical protein LC612_36760 [Nostoc sp. CHAB 5834]|nr:hypothetical protein [Nostoc sp. CHAB 5834]
MLRTQRIDERCGVVLEFKDTYRQEFGQAASLQLKIQKRSMSDRMSNMAEL